MEIRHLQNIILFGDDHGIPELTRRIPRGKIAAIIAASNRPKSHALLQQLAQQMNVPFFIQPPHQDIISMDDFLGALQSLKPDSLICHSYAMLIRAPILSLVGGHAFNIHAALLPRNRGPNPIQWALIHGDAETGVTLHQMDEGFDTGPVIAQEALIIAPNDTWISLKTKLERTACTLLDRALPELLQGNWQTITQNEAQARTNPRITPDGFEIDFATMTDRQIYNLIRAQIAPLAGPYIMTTHGKLHLREFIPLEEIPLLRERYGS